MVTSLVRGGLINNTGRHTLYHWYYDYGFGQVTTILDRLCGTHKSPLEGCEDVPEGETRPVSRVREPQSLGAAQV